MTLIQPMQRLATTREAAQIIKKSEVRSLNGVACSNMCFSIEMFLKSFLLALDIDFKNTHNLNSLFKKLPPKYQDKMKDEVTIEPQEKFTAMNDEVIEGYENFDEALTFISNDFIKMRYTYERYKENGGHIFMSYGLICEVSRGVGCVVKREIISNKKYLRGYSI